MTKNLLFLFSAIFLSGCATTSVYVEAESIAEAPVSQNCAIVPVMLPKDPFVKSAIMRQVRIALYEAGYQEARNVDEVDQIIGVGFKAEDMEVSERTVTLPIYAQTGGGTTTFSGYTTGSRGGYRSFSGTAYSPPRYGVVGINTQTYRRYTKPYALIIDAVDGRRSVRNKKPRPLWRVTGVTMTVMDRTQAVQAALTAMIPSIGKNFSTREICVKPPSRRPTSKARKPLSATTSPQNPPKLKRRDTSS